MYKSTCTDTNQKKNWVESSEKQSMITVSALRWILFSYIVLCSVAQVDLLVFGEYFRVLAPEVAGVFGKF